MERLCARRPRFAASQPSIFAEDAWVGWLREAADNDHDLAVSVARMDRPADDEDT